MILVELGGGTAPHPEATVVIDTHHPKASPAQDATATPWVADAGVLTDGSVDVVYASHFLEHVPHGEPLLRVFNEAWRVLRPGGRFNMRLPLVGYTQPSTGEPVRDHIGWQPWADPTHVSYWWAPECLLYFCEGPFKPNADYGISTWAPLGNWTDDPFARPHGGWYANHGWELVASLVKP